MAAGGVAASDRLRRWNERRRTPEWRPVKKFLVGIRHDALHNLSLEDVQAAVDSTEHAIEEIRPAQGTYAGISDFCPPFAMEYLFHDCLEDLGRTPLWQDIKTYLFERKRDRYVEPFLAKYRIASGSRDARLDSPYFIALKYRVGNAYYSFIREVHLMTVLRRKYGLDVRYHVFADVEYKSDLVAGDVLVALYVPNGRYRDGADGRKTSIATANPSRKTLSVTLAVRKDFGKPWLVTDEAIKDIAEKLMAEGCPRLPPSS